MAFPSTVGPTFRWDLIIHHSRTHKQNLKATSKKKKSLFLKASYMKDHVQLY